MTADRDDIKEQRTANTSFASGGLTCKPRALCYFETFVMN